MPTSRAPAYCPARLLVKLLAVMLSWNASVEVVGWSQLQGIRQAGLRGQDGCRAGIHMQGRGVGAVWVRQAQAVCRHLPGLLAAMSTRCHSGAGGVCISHLKPPALDVAVLLSKEHDVRLTLHWNTIIAPAENALLRLNVTLSRVKGASCSSNTHSAPPGPGGEVGQRQSVARSLRGAQHAIQCAVWAGCMVQSPPAFSLVTVVALLTRLSSNRQSDRTGFQIPNVYMAPPLDLAVLLRNTAPARVDCTGPASLLASSCTRHASI
jgi:hypothetical protein